MKKLIAFFLALICMLGLIGCQNEPNTPTEMKSVYTYEELSEMPAEELLNLFVENGLVINDGLKASFTEEEIQILFKEQFDMWHRGISSMSHTMYCDLAEQTKEIYDKITEPKN